MERESDVVSRTLSRLRRWGELGRVAAAVIAGVALVTVMVSAVVLVGEFRPDVLVVGPTASFSDVTVDPGLRYAPQPWVRIHERSLDVAGTAALIWAVLTAALVRTGRRGRTVAVMVGAAAAVLASLAAGLSWGVVRWDQLALWEVTVAPVGVFRGLWAPAFDERVRFLLVGGAEVGQGTYRRGLLVHLGAPVVALAAIATSTWLSRPSRGDRTDGVADAHAPSSSSTVEPEPDARPQGHGRLAIQLATLATLTALVVAVAATGCSGAEDSSIDETDRVTYTLELGEPSQEHSDEVQAIVAERLEALDVEATISGDGSTVTVAVSAADAAAAEAAVAPPVTIEFRPVLEHPADPSRPVTPSGDITADGEIVAALADEPSTKLLLGPAAPGIDLESATAEESMTGEWAISPVLTSDGIDRFNELAGRCYSTGPTCPPMADETSGLLRGLVAILIGGELVSAPSINAPSFERDQILISGDYSEVEAERLAAVLNSGAGVPTWTLR